MGCKVGIVCMTKNSMHSYHLLSSFCVAASQMTSSFIGLGCNPFLGTSPIEHNRAYVRVELTHNETYV